MYIKFVGLDDILIVCVYVEDLIFIGNYPKMIAKFKEAMINCFKMTNLVLTSYLELILFRRMMAFSSHKGSMLLIF